MLDWVVHVGPNCGVEFCSIRGSDVLAVSDGASCPVFLVTLLTRLFPTVENYQCECTQ